MGKLTWESLSNQRGGSAWDGAAQGYQTGTDAWGQSSTPAGAKDVVMTIGGTTGQQSPQTQCMPWAPCPREAKVVELMKGDKFPPWDHYSLKYTAQWTPEQMRICGQVIQNALDELDESSMMHFEAKRNKNFSGYHELYGAMSRKAIWDRCCRSRAVCSITVFGGWTQPTSKEESDGH